MAFDPEEILSILDRCCDDFTFPMLDSGYVYLAATRLSLYRSAMEWAIVIEVFILAAGRFTRHSYLHLREPASRPRPPEGYFNRQAYENYLANNPHNESRFVFPVDEGS